MLAATANPAAAMTGVTRRDDDEEEEVERRVITVLADVEERYRRADVEVNCRLATRTADEENIMVVTV